MSTHDDDDDTPTGPQGADRYPSAQALVALGGLLKEPAGPDRGAKAWRTPTQSVQVLLRNAGYRTGLYGKYLNGFKVIGPAVPAGSAIRNCVCASFGSSTAISRIETLIRCTRPAC